MNITEAIKTLKSQCNELSTYGANPVLKQAIEVLIGGYEQLKANQPARCDECVYLYNSNDKYPCNMCSSCYTNKFKQKESE